MTPLLDQISLVLVYSAIAVYACAFVAFALQLARSAAQACTPAPERVSVVAGPLPAGPADTGDAEPRPPVGTRGRVGYALTVLGAVLHVTAAVLRGIAADRVPWANMFEFSLTGTALIIATFLLLSIWARTAFLGTAVLGLATLLLGTATVSFYVPVIPLVPALQSAWLVIHVMVALLACACFGLSFLVSVTYLVKARPRTRAAAPRLSALLGSVPGTEALERLAYRLNIVGFALWTFTLIAGAIWAGRAWGRYWGWDVKEVWTFIIWVIYAAYIHAMATRGWHGRRAAWLSIIGFAAVLFNFGVVNVFFTGLHSYSGL